LAALRISQQRFGLDLDLLASQNPDTGVWEVEEDEDTPEDTSAPSGDDPSPPAEQAAPTLQVQSAAGGWVDTGASKWL
jgi:hypothetical protein